jgi:molecular chaperone GrpE
MEKKKDEAKTEDARSDEQRRPKQKINPEPRDSAAFFARDASVRSEEQMGEAEAEPKAEDEMKTKYMRLAADFQNFKRRTEEERLMTYSRAKEDFAETLLPVLDNFEHALASSDGSSGAEKIIEGMGMILSQFTKILEDNGIEEISAEGLEVDPNIHHAVQTIKKDGVPEGQVVKVIQKGYKIGDKLIRPASVVVSE